MKLAHLTVVSVAALAVFGSVACKGKDGNAGTTTSAASVDTNGTKPAEKAAAPAEVPLDQFLTKVVPATCKTITECKNDKVKVAATMPVMLITGFGTIDKPELGKEVKGVDDSMKADKRFIPNEKECTTLGNVALKVLDMDAEKLNAKVGKTIAYDAKKASACITSLGKAPNECSTEVKLATEPKMGEIDAISKEVKPSLDGFAQPCEDVVTGLVDVGGACDSDLECKGKGMKCKAGAASKGAAKGGKTAAGKVCQPKK
jgi:hypothetical protein